MKISELPKAAAVTDVDITVVVQDGETRQISRKTFIGKTPDDLMQQGGKMWLTANGQEIGAGAALPKTVTVSEFAPAELAALTVDESYAGWGIRAGVFDAKTQTFAWEDAYARLPKLDMFLTLNANFAVASSAAYGLNMMIPMDNGTGEFYILLDKDYMEMMIREIDLPEQVFLNLVQGYYLFVPRQDASGVLDVYLFCGVSGSGLGSAMRPLIRELYESFVYIVEHTYKAGVAFIPFEKETEA